MKSWIGGTSNPFSIDYSKRGTAKCQKCKSITIGQDELIIGKSLPFKGKFISRYFHVPCAFAMFRKAKVATSIGMFTNADQLTSPKISEIKKHIENEKPMIVAVCEMKPKNARDGCLPDYNIPNFSKHLVDQDTNIGRGMAIYTHTHTHTSPLINRLFKLHLSLTLNKSVY